jgi:hypothetical protein
MAFLPPDGSATSLNKYWPLAAPLTGMRTLTAGGVAVDDPSL